MADLYASRAPVRLNDGTADANNVAVLAAAPATGDYGMTVRQVGIAAAAALADAVANPTLIASSVFLSGYNGTTWDRLRATTANGLAVDVTRVTGTVTVDSELPAAAALADAAANPTTPTVGADNLIWNGATWDRQKSIVAALDSAGTGFPGAGMLGQLDDTATATVTENQFAPVRISTRRAMLIEGVASGTNLNVALAASSATVTVDSELPAAAALADATANPTVPAVGAFEHAFNGTTWDRISNIARSDGNVALVTTGIEAAGVGPGFARRFNPANLGTVANSASAADVNGAGTASIGVSTSTTGTFTIEVSSDSTNWVAAIALDVATQAYVTGTSVTPTTGKVYLVSVNGMRQIRLRTVGTLGATVAHTITLSLGDAIEFAVSALVQSVNLSQVGGAAFALGQTTMSASLPVTLASNQGNINIALAASSATVTVDTELTAAASLADATANPTITNIAGLMMGFNGTTWDRVRTSNTGRLQVDVITGAGGTQYVGDAPATATPTGTIAMGLANAAAPANVSANNDAVAQWMLLNGSPVVNLASGGTLITAGQKAMAASLPVVIASDQATFPVTADTELSAASAASDAFANPTAGGVLGFSMGFNGTTWDRIRTANTGRLQVDVITGGGSPPASEIPTSYNALVVYGTTAATAAGATASVVSNVPASTKLFYVRSVHVASSGATKFQVKFGATVLATGFLSSAGLSQIVRFDPPLSGTGDAVTALTIDVTNREASAMDLYARLGAIVLA